MRSHEASPPFSGHFSSRQCVEDSYKIDVGWAEMIPLDLWCVALYACIYIVCTVKNL